MPCRFLYWSALAGKEGLSNTTERTDSRTRTSVVYYELARNVSSMASGTDGVAGSDERSAW